MIKPLAHETIYSPEHKMKMEKFDIDKQSKEMPFSVPDGYFDKLEEEILAQTVGTTKHISLWQRMKPFAYAAAMIVGVMFITRQAVYMTRNANAFGEATALNEEAAADSTLHQMVLDEMDEDQLVEFLIADAN